MANILALEPYYGGSHRAFLQGWCAHSRHHITALTLRPHHWKWRMRHAGLTFAEQVTTLGDISRFDMIWCSSMVNLAEFLGTCPTALRRLPSAVYFHENQLAYPNRHDEPRDVHFAFTHWASLCAATEIWFNSNYNQKSLMDGLAALFQKMPDCRNFDRRRFEARSFRLCPGIDALSPPPTRRPGALRIAWAARFEHDKGPELLLQALRRFSVAHPDFKLTVLGEQFGTTPSAMVQLKAEFQRHLDHFGFEPDRERYIERLQDADIFISTAQHEFFGLAVMEAAACGCSLLLPNRLCYPELFATPDATTTVSPFYDNTAEGLHEALVCLAKLPAELRPRHTEIAKQYTWSAQAPRLDEAVDRCIGDGLA